MKLIINFIIILILSMNISISAEKKDCSVYKKISKRKKDGLAGDSAV